MALQQHLDEFQETVKLAKGLQKSLNLEGENISDAERYFFYENIFIRIFRAYENLIEEAFLDYLVGEPALNGDKIECFLKPNDKDHARKMITSGMPFLDWTSPSNVIDRSETYMRDGGPIKVAIASSQQFLQQAKKIRNHVAHNSTESFKVYSGVVKDILLTLPMKVPVAGELLATIPKQGNSKNVEVLQYFIGKFESTAKALVS